MNLYAQRIFSKFSRDVFIIDGSQFRWLHRLSCISGADRAVPCLIPSHSNSKDFYFPCTASLQSRSVLRPPAACDSTLAGRGSVLIICQRFNASNKQTSGDPSEKKSLVQAKESPYAHLTPGQKGKRTFSLQLPNKTRTPIPAKSNEL